MTDRIKMGEYQVYRKPHLEHAANRPKPISEKLNKLRSNTVARHISFNVLGEESVSSKLFNSAHQQDAAQARSSRQQPREHGPQILPEARRPKLFNNSIPTRQISGKLGAWNFRNKEDRKS